ncbi:hypothetical protein BD408DRAFT_424225 [Parasitella parasitica]|nr:hypothetical protein BD408DRAFT_424225 [Parasitella parasitica]
MTRIIVLLFAMAIMVSSCLAAGSIQRKARLSRREVPDAKTAVKLAQFGVHNMLGIATTTTNQELHLFQPKTPPATASGNTGAPALGNAAATQDKTAAEGDAAASTESKATTSPAKDGAAADVEDGTDATAESGDVQDEAGEDTSS